MFPESFMDVSRKATRLIQESFMGVSRKFQGCFKAVLKVFLGSFKDVS